jgi:hypothetical protein
MAASPLVLTDGLAAIAAMLTMMTISQKAPASLAVV